MTLEKMNEQELEQVNGGFAEANSTLPTAGMSIVCPDCHNGDANSFAQGALYDPEIGSVEYRCKCGCKFVCYKGQVIRRKQWDATCKAKGISYPF